MLTAAKDAGLSSINNTLTTAGTGTTATCHVDVAGTGWAAEAPLFGSTNASPLMWCVDNTGKSKQESTNLAASGIACN